MTAPEDGKTVVGRLRLYLVRHGESEANKRGVFAGQLDSPLTKRGVNDAKSLGERSQLLILQPPAQPQGVATVVNNQEDENFIPFDLVFSSDLERAHDTCKLILEGLQTRKRNDANNRTENDTGRTTKNISSLREKINIDKRLRERSYGTLQGMPWNSDRTVTDKLWRDTHQKDDLPPTYESDDDIWDRVKSFLRNLVVDELMTASTKTKQQLNRNELVQTQTLSSEIPTKHILITSHAGVLRQMLTRLVGVDKLENLGAKFDAKRKNRLIIPNVSLTILELSLRCEQQDACSGKYETQNSFGVSKGDDNDVLEGIQADVITYANTDHLESEGRIHDD